MAADYEKETTLSYKTGGDGSIYATIIEETVFAVGYNERHIIAEQHPHYLKTITNYFILPIKNTTEPNDTDLIGPLTLEQFNKKRKDLNIPDSLKFTIIMDNLK